MRSLLALILLASPVMAQTPAHQPVQATGRAITTTPIKLTNNQISTLTLGFGVITTIRFDSKHPVDRVLLGQKIVAVGTDDIANGRIDFRPLLPSGETNMIIKINGVDYPFVVQITRDLRQVVYTRTYVLEGDENEQTSADLMRLANGAPMRPEDINPVKIVKKLQRAVKDPIYRKTITDLRQLPIDRTYSWNGCIVHLLEADAFLDSDMILFKVQWVNTTGFGIYLSPSQLDIKTAGKAIRLKTAHQDCQDSIVEPGSMDTIWLIAQGERYGLDNDWELQLPPDAATVRKSLE